MINIIGAHTPNLRIKFLTLVGVKSEIDNGVNLNVKTIATIIPAKMKSFDQFLFFILFDFAIFHSKIEHNIDRVNIEYQVY